MLLGKVKKKKKKTNIFTKLRFIRLELFYVQYRRDIL